MAVRLRDRPHVTLPLGGQGVNVWHEIGGCVSSVFNGASDAHLVPTLARGATNAGPAVIPTSTKQVVPALWQASPTTKATLVAVMSMAGGSGNFGAGLGDSVRIRKQGATTCALFLSTSASGDSYSSNFTVPSGAFTIIVQLDFGGSGYTVWVDGVQKVTASYSGVIKTSTLQLQLGGNEFSNGGGTSVSLAYAIPKLLSKGERDAVFANPYLIFDPDEDVESYSAGSTVTATTSLSAAIQIARTATAGVNVAVQAGASATASMNTAVQQARTASVSLAAAVQEARSTTTILNAAVQAATSTSASVNTAVQAPASASASLNTAVQQARSATPSVDAAVQAQGTATASVNAAVQAGQVASSAVDVAIQQARAATVSINTAVQASQVATASINAAVQAVGSATVGLNTYVQSDGTIGVSLNAAIQAQQQASVGLNLAVQLARSAGTALDVVVALAQTASVSLNAYIQAPSEVTTALNAAIQDARSATVSLNAAVQVQRSAQVSLSAALAVGQLLTAAVDVAVRAARSRSASLSAYIFDDSAPIPQRDFMRDISSYAAAPAPISAQTMEGDIRATLLGTSIRIHPR